jgi:hypothetical protein
MPRRGREKRRDAEGAEIRGGMWSERVEFCSVFLRSLGSAFYQHRFRPRKVFVLVVVVLVLETQNQVEDEDENDDDDEDDMIAQ